MPKILVVEDEPLVRALAVDLLAELGFAVDEAGSAAEAMRKVATGAPDGIMIDLGLPDQPGDQVVGSLRQSHPQLAIIIASGANDADLKQMFAGDPSVVILTKPYSVDTLEQALRSLGLEGVPQA